MIRCTITSYGTIYFINNWNLNITGFNHDFIQLKRDWTIVPRQKKSLLIILEFDFCISSIFWEIVCRSLINNTLQLSLTWGKFFIIMRGFLSQCFILTQFILFWFLLTFITFNYFCHLFLKIVLKLPGQRKSASIFYH